MINFCRMTVLIQRKTIEKFLLIIVTTLLVILPSSADIIQDPNLHANPPYVWMDRCDKEIGATVPAFSCTDNAIGVVAPKVMHNTACEKPEDLNTRCVHMSRVGRLKSKNPDVDMIFSCRKSMGSLHKGDNSDKFWDVALIQYNRKNGKTCFYQHLSDNNADDVTGAPKSNSKEGRKFWDLRVDFCTGCHTNGPFVRSPHYYKDVKDKGAKRYVPEKKTYTDPVPYQVIHDHFPVYNVDFKGNECTSCHNIGAFFALGKMHLGEISKLAAGTIKSLRAPDHPSPTKSGYNYFMIDKANGVSSDADTDVSWDEAKKAIKELQACLVDQTRATIDKKPSDGGPPDGCKITPVSTYNAPLPCLTRECEEIQR